ncbi:NnrU family protein [Phenylobacterium sp.]|uniref:NnrU family protein n=1 Tax=Phenylobacterium sp. TaxID=1871053 RepID=UPI0027188032|nr:NnrU family protein [Phenylobacterium sp.]MDO8378478.1 NnrU family protein [Phenylobacterium sp.]
MTNLLAAAAFFILLHLLVSGTRLRGALTGTIGEGPYMGLFSLASAAGLAWLGFAFADSRNADWNLAYWEVTPLTWKIQLGVQALAFLFVVVGLTTPNPTSVRQEGALDRPDLVKGMLRITRHPFLWGLVLWAGGHLLVNGDRASIALFGGLLVLALFGTASIDAKRKRALGDKWNAFAAQTSNIPFGAILTGRQTLKLGEIGLWRILAAIVVYIALALAHPFLFGVSAVS